MHSYSEQISINKSKLEMILFAFCMTLLAIILSIISALLPIIFHMCGIGGDIDNLNGILFFLIVISLSISMIMSLAGIFSSGYRVRAFFIFIVSFPIFIVELFIYSRTLT